MSTPKDQKEDDELIRRILSDTRVTDRSRSKYTTGAGMKVDPSMNMDMEEEEILLAEPNPDDNMAQTASKPATWPEPAPEVHLGRLFKDYDELQFMMKSMDSGTSTAAAQASIIATLNYMARQLTHVVEVSDSSLGYHKGEFAMNNASRQADQLQDMKWKASLAESLFATVEGIRKELQQLVKETVRNVMDSQTEPVADKTPPARPPFHGSETRKRSLDQNSYDYTKHKRTAPSTSGYQQFRSKWLGEKEASENQNQVLKFRRRIIELTLSQKLCVFCGEEHRPEQCRTFTTSEERYSRLRMKGRCVHCWQQKHSNKCNDANRRKCLCGGHHDTSLCRKLY